MGITETKRTNKTNYHSRSARQVLDLTLAHAYNHQCIRTPLGEEIFALVHPFYSQICHYKISPGEYREEIREISKKSIGALIEAKKLGMSRVIFETADHYPAGTAHLVEQGLVDRIVVTKPDQGCLNFTEEVYAFNNRSVFIGGGFIDKCLYQTACELDPHTRDIVFIKDLITHSPQNKGNPRYNGPNNWQGIPIIPFEKIKGKLLEKRQKQAQVAK